MEFKHFRDFVAERDVTEQHMMPPPPGSQQSATPATKASVINNLMQMKKLPGAVTPIAQAKLQQAMNIARTGAAKDATQAMDLATASQKL